MFVAVDLFLATLKIMEGQPIPLEDLKIEKTFLTSRAYVQESDVHGYGNQ
jgi:hypothetical protein